MSHTLQQYKDEAGGILKGFFDDIRALGNLLRRAEKDLLASEFKELERYLLTYLTQADLRAAVAVAEGRLSPELFPAGTRNSKVLTLSELDQRRLLGGEQFQVFDNFGGTHSKTWGDMSPDERNRLLGRKGGKLHILDEQEKPHGPGTKKVTVVYQAASYRDRVLSLNGGGKAGEVAVGALREALSESERSALVNDLS